LERLENFADKKLYKNDTGLPNRVHFDRHLYLPLLEGDAKEPPVVKYSPPGLNKGEKDFLKKLRKFVTSPDGKRMLKKHNCELFLLRNRSRGHGIGFLPGDEGYYPDFILWLKSPDQQNIAFIEPHGLITGGDLKTNSKVQFYKTIKIYERKLNQQASRNDVFLSSFIISQTDYKTLKIQTGINNIDDFHAMNIYFPKGANYVLRILKKILGK
ncbi:MAG: type III restriction endonuclease subunit R, partial [Chloroflexota bacterium]|nr:type III restriction endonuclease subunit R [Chloroflexota bacterium]